MGLLTALLQVGLNGNQSLASHSAGADLTYKCLGGNNYRFFFTFYRDCGGIAADSSYSFWGTSSCGAAISIVVYLDSAKEVRHLCPSFFTKCTNSNSPYMGIQACYYHCDVTLPFSCSDWIFGLKLAICNRNAAINNLTPNASTYCLYVQATLNNSSVQFNNSPVFSSAPVSFLCADRIQFFNQRAFDSDNDSITYTLYTPHSDSSTSVSYIGGLSCTQPVTFANDSTQFDLLTGDIRFYADHPQITVVAVRVSDYRNGVLIGSVERDIELIFESCIGNPSSPPASSGMNGLPVFTTHICYDSLFSFQIFTNDLDNDSTFINWDHSIPGGSLTTIGGLFQTGVFSWHPDSSEISFNPHVFRVFISDNNCHGISTTTYTFQIFVDNCQATTPINESSFSIPDFSAIYSPVSHTITINYNLKNPANGSVILSDITGRIIKKIRIDEPAVKDRMFDVHGLSEGVYILTLYTASVHSVSVKIIIE